MENVKLEYYTAAWCGPCKMMAAPIAELKAAGWNIEKIDVDQNRAQAQAQRIMAVPTFILYKDGVEVQRFSGARQKAAIESVLKSAAV